MFLHDLYFIYSYYVKYTYNLGQNQDFIDKYELAFACNSPLGMNERRTKIDSFDSNLLRLFKEIIMAGINFMITSSVTDCL